MDLSLIYYQSVQKVLDEILQTQKFVIQCAAEWVAETIQQNRIIYTLGSGHSLMIATELYYRAGGMAPFDIIHDKTFGRAERLSGYARILLDSYPISAGDLLFLVSNSGRNPLPVEMAMEAKERGIRTVALTSLRHSKAVPPREGLKSRLFEVADLVIDNCGEFGDASVEIDASLPLRVAPTSTLAGVFVVNAIVAQAARTLFERGIKPPVFLSANVDNGDDWNAQLIDFLRQRIRGL